MVTFIFNETCLKLMIITSHFSPTKVGAIIYLFFSLAVTTAFSQSSEVGLVFGGTTYQGDIVTKAAALIPQMRPMGGIFYRYHLTNRWALRAQFSVAQLNANEKKYAIASPDSFRQKRGVSFTTSFAELAILPELRIASTTNLDFYAFGGLSGFYFNPRVDYNEPNPIIGDKNLDKAANYSRFSWTIPVGAGVRWFIKDQTSIGFELSGRKAATDFIDGLSLSASPSVKDYYFFANFTASTFFGKTKRGAFNNRGQRTDGCPQFN
jgi:Domain of unknown function (DUF6089)